MVLTPTVQTFVMHFGEMGSRWGINRTVGQIYALCVSSEDALTADEIASALNISRGNVSMGLKELQSWRLVKVKHIPGDRKDYYLAMGDVWDMALRVLEERRKREVEPTLSVLRDLLLRGQSPNSDPSSDPNADEYALKRINEIHDLLESVSDWTEDLQTLSPAKLKTLMALGSGVGKILGAKKKSKSK